MASGRNHILPTTEITKHSAGGEGLKPPHASPLHAIIMRACSHTRLTELMWAIPGPRRCGEAGWLAALLLLPTYPLLLPLLLQTSAAVDHNLCAPSPQMGGEKG